MCIRIWACFLVFLTGLLVSCQELPGMLQTSTNATTQPRTSNHPNYDMYTSLRRGDTGIVLGSTCNPYLSLGGFHTCVVEVGGRPKCWGKNNFGQSTVPSVVGLVNWISAGWHHTCAVNLTGVAHCWGRAGFYNRGGQVVPPEVKNRKCIAITAGYDHSCVLFEDGTPHCWGWGSEVMGTDGYPFNSRISRDGGHKQAIPPEDPSNDQLYKMSKIVAGRYHTCGIRQSDGEGMCFGRNDYYQAEVPSGVMVGNIERAVGPIRAVTVGTYNSCAIRISDSRGVCWGHNQFGQSLMPKAGINLPYDAEGLTAISSGEAHSCSLRNNGAVVCWGWNHYKQAHPVPAHKAKLVGTGDFHSCSVDGAGAILCWGWNNFGQCAVPASLTRVEVGTC